MFIVFYTLIELSIGIRARFTYIGFITLVWSLTPNWDGPVSIFNVPPYFDGSNYAFWKVRIRAFLYSIDEAIWDAVEIRWTKPEAAKSTWDKAALTASNANSVLYTNWTFTLDFLNKKKKKLAFSSNFMVSKHSLLLLF